jgi:hypothetical protein
VRDHPPDGETQNSPEDRHPGRVEQNIFEALNNFDNIKNFEIVHKHLQRRFGLLPTTAAVVAEFVAGYPR